MESIYWVLTWACHRRCVHCYDDRFRPYVRDELKAVIGEGQEAWPKIIDNLPARFAYEDPKDPSRQRIGRIILAGGEVLHKPVREALFYAVLEALQKRYSPQDAKISIQTTGDILTPKMLNEMLDRGVHTIAISGMDDYHVGMEGDKRLPLMTKIRSMMTKAGVTEVSLGGKLRDGTRIDYTQEEGPFFLFFGAQPASWIGEIWPRGRAWTNNLADGDITTNFCARQSGAKNFLNHTKAGSEVAIEPNGDVYPCCIKTKTPIGNLCQEPLIAILDDVATLPSIQALNRGDPAAMGDSDGWSKTQFDAACQTKKPDGSPYTNLCIGCDAFFEAKLGAALRSRQAARLSKLELVNP
jgi:sulfatase maturation enzyme AslB (radical SAM superfamily)